MWKRELGDPYSIKPEVKQLHYNIFRVPQLGACKMDCH